MREGGWEVGRQGGRREVEREGEQKIAGNKTYLGSMRERRKKRRELGNIKWVRKGENQEGILVESRKEGGRGQGVVVGDRETWK